MVARATFDQQWLGLSKRINAYTVITPSRARMLLMSALTRAGGREEIEQILDT